MNLNNLTATQRHYLHIIIIGLVALFMVAFLIHTHINVNKTYQQIPESVSRKTDAYKGYQRKRTRLKQRLMKHSRSSSDPIIRSIAVNGYDNTAPKSTLLHFFSIFYDWHSAKGYNKRAIKLRNLANSKVLNNKLFFPRVRNSRKTHTNYIDAEGLNYQFNNLDIYNIYKRNFGNNLWMMVEAQYEKWYDKGRNQIVGATWYNIEYNTNQNKIVAIKQVYNNPKIHDYVSNS